MQVHLVLNIVENKSLVVNEHFLINDKSMKKRSSGVIQDISMYVTLRD